MSRCCGVVVFNVYRLSYVFFIVMLNVNVLNEIMLCVMFIIVMPSVVAPSTKKDFELAK
jgi:hypothetical protein